MSDSDSDAADSVISDAVSEQSTAAERDDDPQRSDIRAEISTMSFEELMKLKEQIGAKVYSETVFGQHRERKRAVKAEFKRDNKNRPREMGAKRPVSLLGNAKRKNAAALATNPVRDPRFDAKCGEFDAQKFKENFGFVDDIKERELGELKERLKTVEDFKEQKKIKYLIQRMQNQSTEKRKRKIRETMRDEERQEIVQAKREKRQPIYKTDRERKAQELVSQFLELKETGKLNKHLEKRRKKNVSRDRKKFSFD